MFGASVSVFYPIVSSGFFSPLILRQGRRFYSPRTGQWHFTTSTLDSSESVGRDVDAAVVGGVLHVFYYAETNGNLRHAYTPNSLWTFENVDGHTYDGWTWGRVNGNVGRHPAIAAGWPTPWVFYEDIGAGILRFAY